MQGIYKIINKVDGKYYVGSSGSIKDRCDGHKRELEKGTHINARLQHAWNKYGGESFSFKCIEEALGGREALLACEQGYLDDGFARGRLYNINGEARCPPSWKGKKHTKEHNERISKAISGKNHPLYGKTGKANPFYGKHHTDETKRAHSEFMKEWHSENKSPSKGKRHSKESKFKMSLAKMGENNPNYGKRFTEEHRARISRSNTGKRHSEESKVKMGKAKAKSYPAFYNVKTEGYIPAGRNLKAMCKERDLIYLRFFRLKSGATAQSYDGWKLAIGPV